MWVRQTEVSGPRLRDVKKKGNPHFGTYIMNEDKQLINLS